MVKQDVRVALRLDTELHDELERYAEQEERTYSDSVRRLLRWALEEKKKKERKRV